MPDRLTEATRGPQRRALTYIGLAAAAIAILGPIAMVVVALGGFPPEALGICFAIWVIALLIVYLVTRALKASPPG